MENAKAALEMIGKVGLAVGVSYLESKYANHHRYSIFPSVSNNHREVYKDQKVCAVCKCKVGDIGVIDKKKYCCMFCYNAVCQNCSPLKCNHSETLKEERVCMNCYIHTIERRIKEEIELNTQVLSEDKSGIISREVLEKELNEYENELAAIDRQIIDISVESEKIKEVSERVLIEKAAKIKQAEEADKAESEKLRKSIKKVKQSLKEKKEDIKKQEAQIEEIKRNIHDQEKNIDKLKMDIEVDNIKYSRRSRVTVGDDQSAPEKLRLLTELNLLKINIEELQVEQNNLRKQLGDRLKTN